MAKPNPEEDSCDEYPYAAVDEGGSGAILRCTEENENSEEGRQLSSFLRSECNNFKKCTFMVTFGNYDSGET